MKLKKIRILPLCYNGACKEQTCREDSYNWPSSHTMTQPVKPFIVCLFRTMDGSAGDSSVCTHTVICWSNVYRGIYGYMYLGFPPWYWTVLGAAIPLAPRCVITPQSNGCPGPTEMEFMKVLFRWRFWEQSWYFSDLRFLPLFLSFYKMLSMNKRFSSLMDCFVYFCIFLKPWGSVRLSSFWCISNYCFYGKNMYLYINKE
jgi:hypothetical protein